ncbi:MAG: hypothetical protein V4662_03350 [Verrucomicrobiota bacterium]
MKKAPIFALLTTASLLTVSVAKWSRLPGSDNKQVNMSLSSAGTTVPSSEGITPIAALTAGDPLRPINVAGGRSSAVIKFTKQSVVSRATFVSDGIEGKVSSSVSTDGKVWNSSVSAVFSPADRFVSIDLGRAQGRYLRMEFELIRGGSIRSFQVFGSHTAADYEVTQSADGTGSMINFASGIGGGRLIYVNPELFGARSEALEANQIDFPESDEKYRTAVYDLGQVRSLSEFGSVHSPRPVRIAVYAFETLPEKEDWRGRLAFDPSVFESTQPVASGEDSSGAGNLKVKPRETVKARYVALRWEPDFNPPNFTASAQIGGVGTAKFNGGGEGEGTGQGPGGEGSKEEGDKQNLDPINTFNPQNSANGVGPNGTSSNGVSKP